MASSAPPRSTAWLRKANCHSLRPTAVHSSTPKNSTISSGESNIILLVERKLPGEPILREQFVAEREALHHRRLTNGPVTILVSQPRRVSSSCPAIRSKTWGLYGATSLASASQC